MSKAAVTVFAFSIYLFGLGGVLISVPNLLLSLFRIPPTEEVWIRVVGVLVVLLGYYYLTAARNEQTPIIRATVIGRLVVLVSFIVFVLLGLAPSALILFGVVDALAATWTGLGLRADERASAGGLK